MDNLPFSLLQCNAFWKVRYFDASMNATTQSIVGANPNRWAIRFIDSAGGLFLGNSGALTVTVSKSHHIDTAFEWVEVTYPKWGTHVQDPWFGVRPSGVSTLSVVEVSWIPPGGGA